MVDESSQVFQRVCVRENWVMVKEHEHEPSVGPQEFAHLMCAAYEKQVWKSMVYYIGVGREKCWAARIRSSIRFDSALVGKQNFGTFKSKHEALLTLAKFLWDAVPQIRSWCALHKLACDLHPHDVHDKPAGQHVDDGNREALQSEAAKSAIAACEAVVHDLRAQIGEQQKVLHQLRIEMQALQSDAQSAAAASEVVIRDLRFQVSEQQKMLQHLHTMLQPDLQPALSSLDSGSQIQQDLLQPEVDTVSNEI